ncbi:hypothetical protein ATCC90586_010399 [Pythium insidiosum]|nr:hypothetical protein ATCC90586_010399 [Pythium insidiosum]
MYDKTPGSVLEIAFVAYKVGMPLEDYRVLTRVHAFFAAIHILLVGLMVDWSLGKCHFSFGPLQELSVHSLRKAGGSKVIADSEGTSPLRAPAPSSTTCCTRLVKAAVKRIAALFARRGFFGVEGAHFDEILAVREIVESSSPTFVQRIMILHCSAFVMPTIFVSRHELTGLKMYNTTIADWGAKAAITESNHPAMMMAYFVRVNMSDTGSLPPGLMTSPFPQNLADIELAVSNLHTLPDHLDTLWPPHMFFFCDHCQFATLPPVLSRMSPYWVSFGVNPFSAFPFEVFQIAGLEHFQLGGVSLPLTPPTADESFLRDTTVRHLYLPGTNLTWLPRWVDTFASLPRSLWFQPALDLTATPLCDAIGEMQAGRLDRFPAEWTANVAADQVSRYMYVERSNVSALANVVMCNGLPKLAYPLDEDDVRYSV